MDISDSGFISPAAFSAEWQGIALLQQRNHNCLYTASRYGKRYVLKGLSADSQSLTDMLLLQQKEFSLGITLSHPHIAETYSLEEVADCGRCIVMEYVDGITLAEWLATNPSHSARQRVMLQLLDALEYIHSLQLVHHDLKSSNILITRNGQNVKLIDFGLSELDTTNSQNDIQHDIQKFGQTLQLLFPSRYKRLRQQCQNGCFANMAAIRLSIEKRQRCQKYIPYIIAIIILIISALLSIHTYRLYQESEQMAQVANEYAQKQQREQEMIEQIYRLIDKEIEQLQSVADKSTSYFSYTQHPLYMGIWALQAQVRDSLANCYADSPDLKHKCIEIWVQEFGTRVMQIDSQVKQSKPIH